MPLFPISFSIHSSKIQDKVPIKKKILSDIIPGFNRENDYTFNKEEDYYNEYKQSIFAISFKKSGWDCMRHYEILACGCIPIYKDLKDCPSSIMTHFPKYLVSKSEELYDKVKDLSLEDAVILTAQLSEDLLAYTKNFLTNEYMAEYILNRSGHNKKEVKSVLLLSGCVHPDI